MFKIYAENDDKNKSILAAYDQEHDQKKRRSTDSEIRLNKIEILRACRNLSK